MKKFNLIIFFSIIIGFNNSTLAETKEDCSKYSTKTFAGLSDHMRCKKGLPPIEKKDGIFSSLNIFKPKKVNVETEVKDCSEYSAKTIVGLFGKVKCNRRENN